MTGRTVCFLARGLAAAPRLPLVVLLLAGARPAAAAEATPPASSPAPAAVADSAATAVKTPPTTAAVAAAPAEGVVRTRTVLASGPLQVGERIPSFAGWTVAGSLLTLDQLLHEEPGAIVLSFFATWCKPCRENLPAVARTAELLKERKVRVVLVAYGENADVVKPWLEANGIALPVILDPFTKIAQRLGVSKALPRTVVIDRRGLVRTLFEVEGSDFENALRLAVIAAMESPTPPKALGRVE